MIQDAERNAIYQGSKPMREILPGAEHDEYSYSEEGSDDYSDYDNSYVYDSGEYS